jgi:nucleotide-binding universal stress UspA family protein
MIMTDERGQAMKPSSLKFKTIVVATDLTDKASSALCYAQALARLHTSTLVVVHVIDPLGYAFPEGAPAFLAADKAAREELAKIEQGVRAQGIPIHSVMESGIVCERILQALNDHHGDLLVLGTRAKTEAGRVALGTIARQLLAKARCPILTVSPDADATLPWAGHWRRVLAATDFSPASLTALAFAHRVSHAQLLALHVSKCGSEDTCSHCLERLRFLAPFNESHTVPVDHIVVTGDAGKVIAEHAQKLHADLVVLGSPVDELMEEDFASSTVLQVISNVKCPVLCVPSTVETPAIEMITEVAFQC